MIEVDISNVWGQIALPDLLAMESEAAAAHEMLMDGSGAGSAFRDWLELPVREPTKEIKKVLKAAEKIRKDSQVCVVVGIGGSYLGPRAAIELLQGPNRNIGRGKDDPQIFFAGNNLSTRHWNELIGLLEDKDFSVIVISKSGTTTEPAIAFRALRWMLERKYGTKEANKRIYAVTDPVKGALRQMATEEGWEDFSIPGGAGGRFSVLSPVGLLPMAVAGIDIMEVLKGAADGKETYDLRSFENPVWLYATVRNLLYRNGKKIEILESFEPGFRSFGGWWQQLFGESEGKDGKGILPDSVIYSTDLHSLGQIVQEGERNIFETVVDITTSRNEILIPTEAEDLDELNYIAGKSMHEVNRTATEATIIAHSTGLVPNIVLELDGRTEADFGYMVYFFELACAVSGYTLGINPFDQPGVEAYKNNMFALLGKKGEKFDAIRAELKK